VRGNITMEERRAKIVREGGGREGLVMTACACRRLDILGSGTCCIAILDL